MAERNYLVCSRVADLAQPVPGSVETECAECGARVWRFDRLTSTALVGQAFKRILLPADVIIVCGYCAVVTAIEAHADDAVEIIRATLPGLRGVG